MQWKGFIPKKKLTKYENCNWKDVLVMISYKNWNEKC